MKFKVLKAVFTGDITVAVLTDGICYYTSWFRHSSVAEINGFLETENIYPFVWDAYHDKVYLKPKALTLKKAEIRYKILIEAAMHPNVKFK